MYSNKHYVELDGQIYKLEVLIRTFKDFYYHLRHSGMEHECPNCGKYNYFKLKNISFLRLHDSGSAEYNCGNFFCNFSFHIEPLSKEGS